MSVEQAVLSANAAFYLALAQGDYMAMERLWARRAPVACIHPGWPVLVGRAAVMESWRRILAQPPGIAHAEAACHAIGDAALVTCYEHIGTTVLAASNLFVREAGAWQLAHHQAGHVLDGEVRPAADGAPPSGRLH